MFVDSSTMTAIQMADGSHALMIRVVDGIKRELPVFFR
jgi:hypothetical protein